MDGPELALYPRGEPWDDGTFFTDGTGWIEGSMAIEIEVPISALPALIKALEEAGIEVVIRAVVG